MSSERAAKYPYVYRVNDRRHAAGGRACRVYAGGPGAGQHAVIVEFPGGGLRLAVATDIERRTGRFIEDEE